MRSNSKIVLANSTFSFCNSQSISSFAMFFFDMRTKLSIIKTLFSFFFLFLFLFFLFYFLFIVKWNQKSSKQSIKYKNHLYSISCFNHFFFFLQSFFLSFFKSVIKLTITNQMFQNQSSINSFFHFDSCSISKHVCYCTPSTITL